MNKRWLKNFVAVCVVLLFLALLLLVTSCATTELTYDPNGKTTWKSTTFLKDVKDAHVEWGPFSATLGSSIGNSTVIPSALSAATLNSGSMWLQGGPLVDMTGQPRGATAAELAVQLEALRSLDNQGVQ